MTKQLFTFCTRSGAEWVMYLLAALSVAGAEDSTKVSQSAAHFQPTPRDGQSCAQCYSFVAPRTCKLVDGEVSPNGWCGLWTQRAG